MMLALALAQAAPVDDDVGPLVMMFVLLLAVAALVAGALVVASVVSGVLLAAVGALAVGLVVVGALGLAAACVHGLLATVVWTRRPGVARWWSVRLWGWLTLLGGPPIAAVFWVLHRPRKVAARVA